MGMQPGRQLSPLTGEATLLLGFPVQAEPGKLCASPARVPPGKLCFPWDLGGKANLKAFLKKKIKKKRKRKKKSMSKHIPSLSPPLDFPELSKNKWDVLNQKFLSARLRAHLSHTV